MNERIGLRAVCITNKYLIEDSGTPGRFMEETQLSVFSHYVEWSGWMEEEVSIRLERDQSGRRRGSG